MVVSTLFLAFLLTLSNGATREEMPCPAQAEGLAEAIRNRIEAGRARGDWTAAGDRIMAVGALPEVYLERGFQEIWMAGGRPTPEALRFLSHLREGGGDGLIPLDYHLEAIDSLLAEIQRESGEELRVRVDLELLLSDAFLVFGSHLLQGRVNPANINPEWLANRRSARLSNVLLRAAESGEFVAALEALPPKQEGYRALKRALSEYRELAQAGGWGEVPLGATLRGGEVDPRIPALRKRLRASGDYTASAGEGSHAPDQESMEPALETAVMHFQARFGLDPDGAVGNATLATLNVSVEDRIRQLEVNMERWRWLPEELGRRHILVNIAGFSVAVIEDGEPVLEMRAIVGRQYRETPVFSGRMTYLVLSPAWHVPPTIAALDKLPQIKKDPAYIAAQGMVLLDAASNQPVDPFSVAWASVTGPDFNRRFRIRQNPGPNNALGDVKFMFPNAHNVYLHDTPSRELFSRTERDFSSGCIRIQRPIDLAEYLLRGDPGWTPEGIRAAINRRVETTVTLREPIPVHVQYWTAWIGSNGALNFRRDLYGRDSLVRQALAEPPPAN